MKTKLTLALSFVAALFAAAPAAAAPSVTEFEIPTAASAPEDIVLGPDGALWFTENAANKIGKVVPSDPPVITEYDVPANFTSPFNITVGPDGKLWFSGLFNGAGGVGRMDTANPANTQGFGGYGVTDPRGITRGPDGLIWLGNGGGTVVRIDPANGAEAAASDFPLGGTFGTRNLVTGPDGNVWVTSFGDGEVARVTPAGVVTRFPVNANALWDIIVGPDNNLWYTAPDGNVAGRMTTAGAFTEFPATAGGDQFGITVGPDGALWIAQAVANSIGRVTTDGQFSEIKGLTAGARPEYIAGGPGNTLWFTEKDGNRIGRITGIVEDAAPLLPPPPPPPPPDDTVAPEVDALALSRTRFRLGSALPRVAAVRTGTTIRFTVSEAARMRVTFRRAAAGRRVDGRCREVTRRNRARRPCTRWVAVRGALSLPVQAGARRVRFAGRLSARRSLRPGRHRMVLTATDAAGNVSAPERARFTLLPRKRRR